MVKVILPCALLILASAARAADQPAITSVKNKFSLIPAGLPNYGIAQGSIFVIAGTSLASTTTSVQQLPLPTQVSDVVVQIIAGTTTVNAALYYVSPTQIWAVLPSSTPIGSGQATVTTAGRTSQPVSIQVVESAFGIATLNGAGTGQAAGLDANYHPLSFTNAANPGDAITLWGSGLGPVSGDESFQPAVQDLSNIPVEVQIGGVPATVTYRGRSQFPGLDQITVIVPPGVQGCYVSTVVRAGDLHSNFATIPVAQNGRTCSEATMGLTAQQVEAFAGKDAFVLGKITVGQSNDLQDALLTGGGAGSFNRYTQQSFNATAGQVSQGSCVVYPSGFGGAPAPAYVSAGPGINFGPPSAPRAGVLVLSFSGGYFPPGTGVIGGSFFSLEILQPGTPLIFANLAGTADIGSFTGNVTAPPTLVWTNQPVDAANRPVVKSSEPPTVLWSGGDPDGYVQVRGAAATYDDTRRIEADFICIVPTSAGRFTIPASVLRSLPVTSNSTPGQLVVTGFGAPQPFTAAGMDYGYIQIYSSNFALVNYQ